MISKMEMKIV